MPRHVSQASFRLAALCDLLMRGNPTTIGHRPMMDRYDLAGLQLNAWVVRLVGDCDRRPPGKIFPGIHIRKGARQDPALDNLFQRRAWADRIRRQTIDFGVAPIGQDQPARAVEEADTLGEVVERHVELLLDTSPLGDVLQSPCHFTDSAGRIGYGAALGPHNSRLAIRAHNAVLDRLLRRATLQCVEPRKEPGAVIRVSELREAADCWCVRVAEDAANPVQLLGPDPAPRPDIELPTADAGDFLRAIEALLAFVQRRLCRLEGTDIDP